MDCSYQVLRNSIAYIVIDDNCQAAITFNNLRV